MAAKRERLFRAKDVYLSQKPEQLACSEDGRHVAFVVGEADIEASKVYRRLWVMEVGGEARQASFGETSVSQPAFSPDGTKLGYLVEREGKAQAAVLAGACSEARVITGFEGGLPGCAAGVKGFWWHPSGRSVLVLATVDLSEDRKKAKAGRDDAHEVDVDEACASMWIVPMEGGKAKRIGPGDGHVACAAWSGDGKRIAYVWGEHVTLDVMWSRTSLYVLEVETGRSRRLRGLTAPGAMGNVPVFSPDGERIVFADGPRAGDLYPLEVYCMSSRGGRAVQVDRVADRDAGSGAWLDDETVIYLQQQQTSIKLRCAGVNGRAGRTLVDWPGQVDCYVPARKAGKVFFTYSETGKPHQVYSLELGSGKAPERLTALNRGLAGVRMSVGELVRWMSPDGLAVAGWLYRPTTGGRAPYATIVVPHGGPQSLVANDFGRSLGAQVYCASGYAVFMPLFRGPTGYGERFMRKIVGDWGPGPGEDVLSGVRMLIRRGLADNQRLLLRGGSYGGYMTAWLVGNSRMFRAAVADAPVTNSISMWGTTDITSWHTWNFGGTPLTRFKDYRRFSPVAHLGKCKTPTLVMTGEEDARVPPGQSYELYRTLRAAGAETGLVLYPRELHGLAEPKHQMDALRRTLRWYRKHLGKDAPRG